MTVPVNFLARPAARPGPSGLRLGVHLPLTGGWAGVLAAARRLRCEAVQVFSGNPRGFSPKPLDLEAAAAFRAGLAQAGVRPLVVHAPYLLNLASPEEEGWRRSLAMLLREMERGLALGAEVVVFHPGSHLGSGPEAGVGRVAEALRLALALGPSGINLAVENTAGAGGSLGGPLAELAAILERGGGSPRLVVALDTAHAHGAGYEVGTAAGVEAWLAEAHRLLGLTRVAVIHVNDSDRPLGSRLDRHAHLGRGSIGREGFRRLLAHPALTGRPGLLETPKSSEADDRRNLALARRLRSQGRRQGQEATLP